MPLSACGTVIEQSDDRILVRVEVERCENCIGCVKFNHPKQISAQGNFPIGDRVRIQTSAVQLAVVSMLVFGFPVLAVLLTLFMLESMVAIAVVLMGSFFFVFCGLRYFPLQNMLKVHAEPI